MRYLLTGATGFVGANVLRQLIARGDEVVCVVRQPNLCTEGVARDVRVVDLCDVDGLTAAMAGCAGVFHVAGAFLPGPGAFAIMERVHAHATEALLEAMARAGVPRMVYCSSSITVGYGPLAAPGNEDSPLDPEAVYGPRGVWREYHDTKLAGEALARGAGHPVVNPDFVLGAWDIRPTSGTLLLQVARRPVPFYPPGGKCFVDAEDCAVGHLLAMDRGAPGRRYLLGSHNVSYREVMSLAAAWAGRRPPAFAAPDLLLRAAGLLARPLVRRDPARFAGLDERVLAGIREARHRSGERARRELGVPVTPLAVTVSRALNWFRAHGYLS